MPVIRAEPLLSFTREIFRSAGSSAEDAALVSDHLVEANLAGVDSHGVVRVPEYVGKLERWKSATPTGSGTTPSSLRLNPAARVRTVRETPTTAVVDGDWGFGQVCATAAMKMAIAKARSYGAAFVAGRHTDHVGRAAAYPLMAAREGLIGMTFVKVNPVMVPQGGRAALLGNNPISVAIPSGTPGQPIFVDVAMSVVAGGRIMVAQDKGERIPEGWAVDSSGRPTTDPLDFTQRGGALLPVGGHKGYALSLVNETLGGILSGAGALAHLESNNAFMHVALDVGAFLPLPEFEAQVRQMVSEIRASPRRVPEEEIMIPGDPEYRMMERRRREGIPLPEKTWRDIGAVAERYGVVPPPPALQG